MNEKYSTHGYRGCFVQFGVYLGAGNLGSPWSLKFQGHLPLR